MLFSVFIITTLLAACGTEKMAQSEKDKEKVVHFKSINSVSDSAWQKLAKKKIYFGHQSVGFNIVDGIQEVMKKNPKIMLNIAETSDPTEASEGIFAHFRVGKNVDPQSKIDGFNNIIAKKISGQADVAFFKFCFVDVLQTNDIDKIFSEYKKTMSSLQKQFPKTIFIHSTVPLTYRETGTKALITKTKSLIKKIVGGYDWGMFFDNRQRHLFNEKIRQEYTGKEPIFDIAKRESTRPDGSREIFTKGGKNFFAMVPEYTDDGGHLNEKGRQLVAEYLLVLLSEIIE